MSAPNMSSPKIELPSGIFDLSSVLYVQKQYLDDLSGYILNNGKGNAAGYVNNIEHKLNDMYTKLNGAKISSQYIIDHQSVMSNIIDEEKKRLESKQSQIDNKVFGTKRMIELNDSYRKRQNEYNNIFIIIVIALTFIILIIVLQRFFNIIPLIVANIIILLVVVISIIYIGNVLFIIYSRDNLNFDRTNLPPPKDANDENKNYGSSNNNDNLDMDLLSNLMGCNGPSCCSNGTVWDQGNNICIIPPKSDDVNNLVDLTAPNSKEPTYISSANCTTGDKKICGLSCVPKNKKCYQEGFEVLPKYSLYNS